MSKSFYTGNDTLLYTGSNAFAAQITTLAVSLGLTEAQIDAYQAVNDAYAASYLNARNPDVRTRGVVAVKDAARDALRIAASNMAKILDANPAVTDAMKLDFGLNVRKQPEPAPRPDFAPDLDVVSTFGHTVKIRLRGPSSERRGRPVGVAGAAVFSYVGPTAPTTSEQWKWEGNTNKTLETIEFPDGTPAGSTVWFTATWFNRKGETGPGATPISKNLPGGAVSISA